MKNVIIIPANVRTNKSLHKVRYRRVNAIVTKSEKVQFLNFVVACLKIYLNYKVYKARIRGFLHSSDDYSTEYNETGLYITTIYHILGHQ